MTTKAIDVSNYTDPLTVDALNSWKQSGVGLVIVQSVAPNPPFPSTKTRQQIEACVVADMEVDVYVWLWFDSSPSDVANKLSLISGYENQIRQIWLDVEDSAASKYDQTTTESKVQTALDQCDSFSTKGGLPTGIYTGHWFWTDRQYMGNTTTFSDRRLWDANYDGKPDASIGFVPYGGWSECSIKQYIGSTSMDGIDGIDLNVLSQKEEDLLVPSDPENPCAGMIVTIADIADRLGDELLAETKRSSMRKTVVRKIVKQMQDEREQSIGPRP